MTEPLGTLKSKFSRTYILLNPDPYLGPNTWRLSNVPATNDVGPDDNALKDIYTLLPINKTEVGSTTNLFFDIANLPTTNEASREKNYSTSVLSNFFSQSGLLPRRAGFSLTGLKGIDPIKTIVNDDTGVIYFDMQDLPTLDDVRRNRSYYISARTFKYNSRSVDVLTADAPLEAVTSNKTATVSLDFRNLPEA